MSKHKKAKKKKKTSRHRLRHRRIADLFEKIPFKDEVKSEEEEEQEVDLHSPPITKSHSRLGNHQHQHEVAIKLEPEEEDATVTHPKKPTCQEKTTKNKIFTQKAKILMQKAAQEISLKKETDSKTDSSSFKSDEHNSPPSTNACTAGNSATTFEEYFQTTNGPKTLANIVNPIHWDRIDSILLNEAHRQWKRNIAYTYDFCMAAQLEWPSMTVEWMPDTIEPPNRPYSIHRIVLGTNAADGEENRLLIYRLHLAKYDSDIISDFPLTQNLPTRKKGKDECIDFTTKLYCYEQFRHEGPVQRARVMPQRNGLVATKGPSLNVFLYDVSKPPEYYSNGPYLTLKGHTKGGNALTWDRIIKGRLLSGSDDGIVCIWDVTGSQDNDRTVEPIQKYRAHKSQIIDIDCNRVVPDLFASCGTDRKVTIWDSRSVTKVSFFTAHENIVTSIAFQPKSEHHFLTGSTDQHIHLWDLRNLKTKLDTFLTKQSITSLKWCPQHESVFVSTGSDGRVLVWDYALSNANHGRHLSRYDLEEGPNELMFVHGGHLASVPEASWCSTVPLMMASVDQHNMMYITRMGQWNYYHLNGSNNK